MFLSKFKLLNKFKKITNRSSIYTIRNFNSNCSDELTRIRNIGIIAHVDAGKTTTTERMLYYSGLTENIGDVDKGNTVTDYMIQERERGITITSTPVQFKWNKHMINLIDTPGHVDFNYEVERCLTVLDGSVVLLDASAGVEPQTYKVWKQSNNFQIPKIIYLNKMDKPRSNYQKCLNDIYKFKTDYLLLQLPVLENNKFIGVIDLIKLEKIIWNLKADDSGIMVENRKLTENDNEYKQSIELKEELISKLCEHDNELSEQLFKIDNPFNIPNQSIINSIRKSTIKNQLIPVLMGSSFKNIGIQLLMDSITRYLPCPLEKKTNKFISKLFNNKTSAFLFKIKYDKHLGALYFVRLYDGELKPNQKLINYSKNKEERIEKIFKVFGNDYQEIKIAKKGDIVALTGLQSSSNGDLFLLNHDCCFKLDNFLSSNKEIELTMSENIILNGLKFPEPVIFCSVEAPSVSKEIELENALKRLQQEDPSFSVVFNKETNQTILRGMGDLHLQIIKDRIKRDFKLDPYYGNLQIAYLESLNNQIDKELQLNKTIKDIRNNVYLKVILKPIIKNQLKNSDSILTETAGKIVKVIKNDENELYKLRNSHLKCIEKGALLALESGPLLGNKVINLIVELHDFKTTSKTLDTMIISSTYECIKQAFKENIKNFYLLEPIMKMTIEYQDESKYEILLRELANRRAEIGDLEMIDNSYILNVKIPLAETIDLSSNLRSITSGKVDFSMQISNYLPINKSEESKIINEFKFGLSLN